MCRQLLCLMAGLLLCAVAGCGGGEYARRVANRVEQLNAQFSENFDQTTEFPGMRAVLYRPLKQLGKPLQEKASDGKEVSPQRLQPPIVLPFPLRATYEVFAKVQDEDGQVRRVPYYCYLLSEESVKHRDPYYVVIERAQSLVGDGLEGPREIACQARDGNMSYWRWLRGTHKWQFFAEELQQPDAGSGGKKGTGGGKPVKRSPKQSGGSAGGDHAQHTGDQSQPTESQPSESEGGRAASDGRMEATIEIYARRQGGEIVVIVWLIPQVLEQPGAVENPPPAEQLRRQFAGNIQFLNK